MSDRPRLLDLFSGAGGAARGYQLAGFHVTGVDHKPQPRYAGDVFIQADALNYVAQHGHEYGAIHASPPCQAYSATHNRHKHIEYPDLLGATRTLLERSGRPWVIENVIGAPIHSGIYLCGVMFGLRVYRHRWFETPFMLMQPHHGTHPVAIAGGYQKERKARWESGGFLTITGDPGRWTGVAMGIDWMTGNELSQAIPPAYTRFIGTQLLAALAVRS